MQCGWHLLGSHVQDEACTRYEAAEGVSAGNENKKGRQRMGRSMQKVRKMACVFLRLLPLRLLIS